MIIWFINEAVEMSGDQSDPPRFRSQQPDHWSLSARSLSPYD